MKRLKDGLYRGPKLTVFNVTNTGDDTDDIDAGQGHKQHEESKGEGIRYPAFEAFSRRALIRARLVGWP